MPVYCHLCPIMDLCEVGKPLVSVEFVRSPSLTESLLRTNLMEVMVEVTKQCPFIKVVKSYFKNEWRW